MPGIAEEHRMLFEYIESLAKLSIPHTPPMTLRDLEKALGVKRCTIDNAKRREEWKPAQADSQSGKQKKRWMHIDSQTHFSALKKIREVFPGKIMRRNSPTDSESA
jgi:uncharacterized protein YjcR